MFGFSKQKILVTAVKNACDNAISKYDQAIKEFLNQCNSNPEMSEDEINALALNARRNYLNAVCDGIWNSFAASSPSIHARFRLAMTHPEMTGLPKEMNLNYFNKNGVSAGATFAFAFFALTNKQVDSTKLLHTISMLNHYQDNLMNGVLKKYDS